MRATTVLVQGLLMITSASLAPAMAQTIEGSISRSVPTAASSATVVPMLVRYDGVAAPGNGKAAASMTFLIYKDEKGGEPLWIETQSVATDAAGRYEIYLGSTYSSGLPPSLFNAGDARWLEVQIAGETPGPRTLLTSVPYALKASDAATLGGLPASAFMLAPSLTGGTPAQAEAITPDASSTVTTTGGANFYMPRFSTATSIINSQIYDNGTSVGVGGVPNASVKLDVNGAMIMRGNMQVTRTGNATTSKGYPSYGFQFYSNAYNSSSKASDNPYFQLQSEPTGNDTASPSATFNLLFSNNGSAAAETGFYINPDGTIHFASNQTFPATSSTGTAVSGTSGSGIGVEGTSTAGTGVEGVSNSSYGVEGTSASAYGVMGSTGACSNLCPQYAAGVLGRIGITSGFSGVAGVWGDAAYQVGVLGTSAGNQGVQGISSTANGVQGYSSYGSGVAGGSFTGAGVNGSSNTGSGVLGTIDGGTDSTAGVTGQAGGTSGLTGIAGVWGDTVDHVGIYGTSVQAAGVLGESVNGVGVQGSSTNSIAASFSNNSTVATVEAYNYGSGATRNEVAPFQVFQASTPNGTCGFGDNGNLTCTGQMKSLATTGNGERTVETYSMQSPENWMEDFGSGALQSGTATVTIDAAFAETVSGSADYHVFLTPNGDSKGLYVFAKTATSFEVRESSGGTSTIGFDYRIVAKRKGFEAQRMVDVTEAMKAVNERNAKRLVRARKSDQSPTQTAVRPATPNIRN